MSDYDRSKKFGQVVTGTTVVSDRHTKAYPVEAWTVTNIFNRVEPIITPSKLKTRYLKGIDMSDFTDEELKDRIELAINETEMMANLHLTKTQFKERLPFDRAAYASFVFMKLNNGPVLSVEEVLIESSNGEVIYSLPPDWIEMGLAHKRQINIIPILSIFGASGLQDGQTNNAGLVFLQAINGFRWLPAFFTVKYTAGVCHKEGNLPITINEIVGISTAIEILSEKAALNKYTSQSISQDSISQASGGPGPQIYKLRIEELQAKREMLLKKVKSKFHQKYFMSNI